MRLHRLIHRAGLPALSLATLVGGCAVPMDGPADGDGPTTGKADGAGSACSVDLFKVEDWNQLQDTDCSSNRCKFHFVTKVDVDRDLVNEGFEPHLEYRQEKSDSCWFGCDPLEGTDDYVDEIDGAPRGMQRYRIHWDFKTSSEEPIRFTPFLQRRDGERRDGATYEMDLDNYPQSRREPATVYECETQEAGLHSVAFYDIRDDLNGNARCQRSDKPIDGRLVFDDGVRSGEARDLCVTATSSDEDAARPVVRVHYRFDGDDDFRSLRAETLYEERPGRFVGTYALDLGELDPFENGACNASGETAELEYYVAVEGDKAETQIPAGGAMATVEYRCGGDDTPLPPSPPPREEPGDDRDEDYETFTAPEDLEAINDATSRLHSRAEGYSPLCHEGEVNDDVYEILDAKATLVVPSDFGDVAWAEAVVEISHHYHGDLWVGIQRRIHPEAAWGPVETLAGCDLSGSGAGSAVTIDHVFDVTDMARGGPEGEWRIVVRDYGHDYSGYDGINTLDSFSLRLKKEE